jgi:hypothetical protein
MGMQMASISGLEAQSATCVHISFLVWSRHTQSTQPKPPREDALENRFDELAKTLAGGLTRRS